MTAHYDIYLRDTQTGVAAVYHDDYDLDDPHDWHSTWMWEEGNYSCDCNRSLFLQRAGADVDELECNVCDNRIVIDKIIIRETGEIVASNL